MLYKAVNSTCCSEIYPGIRHLLKFKQWLMEHSSTTKGKNGLYPSLYTQYYNYPPADIVNWSADSITYMDKDDVPQKVVDGYFAKIMRTPNENPGKGSRK